MNNNHKAIREHLNRLSDNGHHIGEIIYDELTVDNTANLRDLERKLTMQSASVMPVLPSGTPPLVINTRPEKREISLEEIKQKIDKETLFLFAFVPFVIAEVAWDYADSCIDLAILLRIHEIKKLSRHIRELRREYDRKRAMIDAEHRKIETDNMIAFQEDYKEFFGKLHGAIQGQVNTIYPGQCMDMQLLTSAAYSCAVVLHSLFKYVDIMSKRIATLLGINAIGSIIVDELRQLEAIIIQFAGEESIGGNNRFPASLNPYVDTLVNYMLESEMIELPCPTD